MVKKHIVPVIISLMCFLLLLYFFIVRFQLGQIRYFDIDELCYLWWARHVGQGLVPYKDAFWFPPPGFFWFLAPLFSLAKGASVFLLARSVVFWVFVVLAVVTSALWWVMRTSWIVIFVPLLLVFLPIPSDKYMEIRPDTLSLTLMLVGTLCLVLWMGGIRKKWKERLLLFFGGFFFGLSVVIFPKVIPQIGLTVLFVSLSGLQRVQKREVTLRSFFISMFFFVAGGLCIAGAIFLWVILFVNDIPLFWYSVTSLAVEASQLGVIYPIRPIFFFLPSDTYFGLDGWHPGIILNAGIWIFGCFVALIRFISLFFRNTRKKRFIELIFLSGLLVNILLYFFYFPLKHAQYLIIPSVFVCFYAADGVLVLWKIAKKTVWGYSVFLTGMVIFFSLLFIGFRIVNLKKFEWENSFSLARYTEIHKLIPSHEPVFDMVGLTVDYPLGYFVPCLTFGQFEQFLSRPLPPLVPELIHRDVKFIYQGDSERIATLKPSDLEYIEKHFTKNFLGDLLIRNDVVGKYGQ